MNIQGWSPLGLTGVISLQSKRLSRVFSNTTIWKHQFFGAQSSLASLLAGFPGSLEGKESACKTWVLSRSGSGISPAEENGCLLQYSCLENSMNRGAWQLQSMELQRVGQNWATNTHPLAAFFMVQLSHPYLTIGKTTALNIWTFVSKVMSLFFNMVSKFVIAFLPRS